MLGSLLLLSTRLSKIRCGLLCTTCSTCFITALPRAPHSHSPPARACSPPPCPRHSHSRAGIPLSPLCSSALLCPDRRQLVSRYRCPLLLACFCVLLLVALAGASLFPPIYFIIISPFISIELRCTILLLPCLLFLLLSRPHSRTVPCTPSFPNTVVATLLPLLRKHRMRPMALI